MDFRPQLAENLAEVRQRIAAAARGAGRTEAEVRLVAVTKYVSADITRILCQLGCHELGESRPQQLWSKAETLADLPVRWHLIGPWQKNKIRRLLPHVSLVHSFDSWSLLEAVQQEAALQQRTVQGLLEVNVSGESAKHGFRPDEVEPLLARLAALDRVQILGLMAMTSLAADQQTAERQFAAMRQLQDRLRTSCPPRVQLHELSMGMSGDFELAIAAGATLVRVGSRLFSGLLPEDD